jgi:rubrerythrin
VDQILDFAIGQEEEAAQFYSDLAGRAEEPWVRRTFEDFAGEEMRHKQKLLAVKQDGLLLLASEKVMDLKIAEYLTDVEPSPDLDYQDALILAMKKEKEAFRMYDDLAETTDNHGLRETLLALAQEEAKHKLRLEIMYDEHVLTEN